MSDFIYNAEGRVLGFRIGDFVYDTAGTAVGRVSAERVYRLDGTYVGEMFRNMVVEKPVGTRPNLRPVSAPPNVEPPVIDSSRGVGGHGFPDVFQRLVDAAPEPQRPPVERKADWLDGKG
jgi:hypothetical protein